MFVEKFDIRFGAHSSSDDQGQIFYEGGKFFGILLLDVAQHFIYPTCHSDHDGLLFGVHVLEK